MSQQTRWLIDLLFFEIRIAINDFMPNSFNSQRLRKLNLWVASPRLWSLCFSLLFFHLLGLFLYLLFLAIFFNKRRKYRGEMKFKLKKWMKNKNFFKFNRFLFFKVFCFKLLFEFMDRSVYLWIIHLSAGLLARYKK